MICRWWAKKAPPRSGTDSRIMKYIPCPLNGLRPESEFICGGSIRIMPDTTVDDATWCEYLFFENNIPGEVWEWWHHVPSGFWFAARRNTLSDEFCETLTVAEAQQLLADGQ